jgi:hypothetical protein
LRGIKKSEGLYVVRTVVSRGAHKDKRELKESIAGWKKVNTKRYTSENTKALKDIGCSKVQLLEKGHHKIPSNIR